jgi:ABC-type lipoprotein export system ATPase subunit
MRLIDIAKEYPGPPGARGTKVLDRVSLDINPGESIAIMGPSGSGKSTLLHIMGTLDQPTSGRVLLEERDLAGLNEPELAAIRSQELGFVFQAHYLLPQCTVLENVLVPTLAGKTSQSAPQKEPAESRAVRLLQRVGLGDRLEHRPGQLSGGEKQRVAVVRALINGPRLLLADEPTGSLDGASARDLGQTLSDLNREQGVTLVVVTHSESLAGLMSKTYELKNGGLTLCQNRGGQVQQ